MARILRHGVVDSTNERAFAALAAGAARDGDVHVAAEQTAGRGRLGRSWESAPGGLYASYVHFPAVPTPPAALLTMATGSAVLETVNALGLAGARLAWPNDLFVGDAKLAGVLVEGRGFDPEEPRYVVGVGLNVRQTRFRGELTADRPVTSLALCGLDVQVEAALDGLLAHLSRALERVRDRPEAICRGYLEATGLAGREVLLRAGGVERRGRLADLHADGTLTLLGSEGRARMELAHVSALETLPHPL